MVRQCLGMMGQHENDVQLFSYRIDLEKRVRRDHPLRRVEQLVDFTFVRQEVVCEKGSVPSIDTSC